MKYRVGYFLPATEGIFAVIAHHLPATCELVTLGDGSSAMERVSDLDFLIAAKVTRQMIEAAPKLKLIMTPGVGSDGVDVAAAQERGIPVAITVCGNTDEVAEHTLLLMLAVSRRLPELDGAMRQGAWLMWDRRLNSVNLAGKTLGLIGFGRIGHAVAERASAFRMNVIYTDQRQSTAFVRKDLDELLETSDYVSLHIPLTNETRRLIDGASLNRMKPSSFLINTSRGEIVDEAALVSALESGRLAGAGLDVFEKEPLDQASPLLRLPNVVLTPHVASGTRDGLITKAQQYSANIMRVLQSEQPIDCISPAYFPCLPAK